MCGRTNARHGMYFFVGTWSNVHVVSRRNSNDEYITNPGRRPDKNRMNQIRESHSEPSKRLKVHICA